MFSRDGVKDNLAALKAANDITRYRGPDGAGMVLIDPHSSKSFIVPESLNETKGIGDLEQLSIGLGHRRLAIIDLTPAGLQPMSTQDGLFWIIYNGEIYNYLELKLELKKFGYPFTTNSDTEVILNAYREWGKDCVHRFNGMWAFAILDIPKKQLFCSRDRFGIKPFHYFFDGKHFVFSSEIKQLLQFPFIPKQVNRKAIYEYLAHAVADFGKETFFERILKLLPGHNLIFDLTKGSLILESYYPPNFQVNGKIGFSEAANEFQYLLRESVRLRLRSDVFVGSCLSGGLDSSSIVCLIKEILEGQSRSQIQRTFSSHFEDEQANELNYMKEVIHRTSVKAHFVYPAGEKLLNDLEDLVWHQEEPFGSTSIYAQWSVFKFVHKHGVKVILDGQGADEILAGYLSLVRYFFKELSVKKQFISLISEKLQHRHHYKHPWSSIIPHRMKQVFHKFHHSEENSRISPPQNWIAPEFENQYKTINEHLPVYPINPFDRKECLNHVLFQWTFHHHLQSLLRYEDRNSMAFSVESRVPFLDHRLVDFVFTLPSKFKIRDGYTKRILRDAMEGILPEKIRWRVGKLGFATPESTWQKTVLRPLIHQALKDGRLSQFLDTEKAFEYLSKIEKKNILNFAPWRWANLYVWMKVYNVDIAA